MSYADPQSWNDVNAGGTPTTWSAVADVRNTLLYPRYEMIRRAIAERCAAAGESVPVPLQTAITAGTIITEDFKNAVQSIVGTLIPLYVNQTASGGDYTGLSAIPMWTEADILTSIGAAERVAVTNWHSAEWLYQQYLILNKLLWVVISQTQGSLRSVWGPITFEYDQLFASGLGWNNFVNNINAASYIPVVATGYSADYFYIFDFRGSYSLPINWGPVGVVRPKKINCRIINITFPVNIDFYAITSSETNYAVSPLVDQPEKLIKVKTDYPAIQESSEINLQVWDKPISLDEPVDLPTPGDTPKYYYSRAGFYQNTVVIKYNISGGFDFQ